MTTVDRPMTDVTDPGWYPDPDEDHHLRYFDGRNWTDHVTHHGPKPCSGCYRPDGADAAPAMPRS